MNVLTFFIIATGFVFLSMHMTTASISLNEIMPNPPEGYATAEWLELYADASANLSGYVLDVTGQSMTFSETVIQDFLVITKNKTRFLELFSIDDSKLVEWAGMGLNNGGEAVILKDDNGTEIDSTTFPSFTQSNKSWAFFNNVWQECDFPSPGSVNSCASEENATEPQLSLSYPQNVESNKNFTITFAVNSIEDGTYDVKLDIIDVNSNRIGKVWDSGWKATSFYVDNALDIIGGSGTASLVFMVENYTGTAILQPKLRKSSTSTVYAFNNHTLTVTVSANQTNETKAQEQETASSIHIKQAPSSAKFGAAISIELGVYRGDTNKYAVYVYVQDSQGTKVSETTTMQFRTKFRDYELTTVIQLKCLNESGIYEIVAEGLDEQDSEQIQLTECLAEETVQKQVLESDIVSSITLPSSITIGKAFTVTVAITNSQEHEQEFKAWSYVYSGPQCYSCTENREENMQELVVEAHETALINLEDIVLSADQGEYKIKIKVLEGSEKTAEEFTYSLFIKAPEQEAEKEELQQEQASEKIMPYMLAFIVAVIIIYLLVKKRFMGKRTNRRTNRKKRVKKKSHRQ